MTTEYKYAPSGEPFELGYGVNGTFTLAGKFTAKFKMNSEQEFRTQKMGRSFFVYFILDHDEVLCAQIISMHPKSNKIKLRVGLMKPEL